MVRALVPALFALAALWLACSSPQHRKPAGPPPEYELPELPDAWTPQQPAARPVDAGTQ